MSGATLGRVAVVGAGRMGAAMVGRLRGAGADVVVFNRTRDRAEAVAERTGARVADTARDAAAAAPVVLVSLADDDAVRSAYRGRDGLVAGLIADHVVLDTSTIDPDTVREMAAGVAGHGAVLLDTPVSGSVPSVERGELACSPEVTRPPSTGYGRCWTCSPGGCSTWDRPGPAR